MAETTTNISSNSTQVNFGLYKNTLSTYKSLATKPFGVGDIVFIPQDNVILLDGVEYGLTTAQKETLYNATAGITAINGKISDIEGAIGSYDTLTKALVAIVTDLRKWADGGAVNADGPSLSVAISGTSYTNVNAAIGALAAAVNTAVSNLTNLTNTVGGHTDELATLKANENTNGSIAKAIKDAKTALIGKDSDDDSADTIKAAKKYAQGLVNELSKSLTGADSTILNTLDQLKAELENPSDSKGLTSFLDKVNSLVAGFNLNSSAEGYTTIKSYIDNINTTLSGNITNAIATANKYTDDQIKLLDKTVRGNLTNADAIETNKKVGIKVVEEDGMLKSVTVVENDIASAAALSSLTTKVENLETASNNQAGQLKWVVK